MKEDALKEFCLRYLDGDLAGDEAEAFNRLVAESPEAARMLARISIHDMCFEVSPTLNTRDSDEAQGDAVPWYMSLADVENERDTKHISTREFVSLTSYVLRQTLTSKHAYKVYAIAATLLLAVTLFLVFGGGDDPVQDSLADQNIDTDFGTDTPVVSPSGVVATLTAEHDAQWDRQPGQNLYAGQRFTLTAGFAEINTNDGAIAILEAPATIELLDNDNAIRLHTGKLVGICETDSSKGFLVRTGQADVVDISTAFVVWAKRVDGLDTTDVQVLDGSVMMRPPPESAGGIKADVLTEGETLRAQDGLGRLAAIPFDAGEVVSAHSILYQKSLPQSGMVMHYGFEMGVGWNAAGVSELSVVKTDGELAEHKPVYADGAVGRSVAFDGSYRVQHDGLLSEVFGGPFTIEAWIRLERGGPVTQRIISNGVFDEVTGNATAGVGLGVQLDQAGAYRPMFTAYGVVDLVARTDLPYDTWVHLAVTVDEQGQVAFYRDGQAVADVDVKRKRVVSDRPRLSSSSCWIGDTRIGSDAHERQYWRGQLDELVVYDRVLQAGDLQRTRMKQ